MVSSSAFAFRFLKGAVPKTTLQFRFFLSYEAGARFEKKKSVFNGRADEAFECCKHCVQGDKFFDKSAVCLS